MGRPLSTVPGRACLALAYPPAVRDLRWAVAGLVVGSTLLTGCSEKVEANETLPSTSASPTKEALPPIGPADFPVPDEARTKDAAGAEAFLRYFIALINRQQAIPDGQPLRDLGPDCADCVRIAARYDEAAAAGQHIEGGKLSLIGKPGTTVSGEAAELSFVAQIEAVAAFDSNGVLVPNTKYPAADHLPSGLGLVWSPADEAWLVSGLAIG
jgi:hypothetical protein